MNVDICLKIYLGLYTGRETIGKQIVRADIGDRKMTKQSFLKTQKKGTYLCLTCQNCSAIIKGPNIMHPTKGYPIPTKGFYTCNTNNVIYLLKCLCGKIYIGQTSRPIKVRINEHKSHIRRYWDDLDITSKENKKWSETSVAKHFYEAAQRERSMLASDRGGV